MDEGRYPHPSPFHFPTAPPLSLPPSHSLSLSLSLSLRNQILIRISKIIRRSTPPYSWSFSWIANSINRLIINELHFFHLSRFLCLFSNFFFFLFELPFYVLSGTRACDEAMRMWASCNGDRRHQETERWNGKFHVFVASERDGLSVRLFYCPCVRPL